MTRRLLLWASGGVFVIVAVGVLAVLFVVNTEAGTAWAIAKARTFMPPALELGNVRGTLASGVSTDRIAWRQTGLAIEARSVRVDLAVWPLLRRRVVLSTVNARSVDVYRSKGDASGGPPSDVELPVDISVERVEIGGLSVRSPASDTELGRVAGSARLDGSTLHVGRLEVDHPSGSVRLVGNANLTDNYPFEAKVDYGWSDGDEVSVAGRLTVDGNLESISVRNSLTTPIAINTTGNVALDSPDLESSLVSRWASIELGVAGTSIRSERGEVVVRGPLLQPYVEMEALVSTSAIPQTHVRLEGRAASGGAELDLVRISSVAGTLTADGSLQWAPLLAFKLEYDLDGLRPDELGAPVAGMLAASGRIVGRFDGSPDIGVRVDRLDGELAGKPVSGALSLEWADSLVALSASRLAFGSATLDAEGDTGDFVRLYATLDVGEVGEFVPALAGRARLELRASGTPGEPTVSITGASEALAAGTVPVEKFEVTTEVVPAVAGRLDRWTGSVSSLALDSPLFGGWTSSQAAPLEISKERLSVDSLCISQAAGEGTACLSIDRQGATQTSIAASLDRLPLNALRANLPTTWKVEGHANVSADFELAGDEVTASATASLVDASVHSELNGEPVTLSFDDVESEFRMLDGQTVANLNVELAEEAGFAELSLQIDDVFDPASPIAGRSRLGLDDISTFAVLVPDVGQLHGRVDGVLDFSGSLARPDTTGQLSLKDGGFSVREAGIEIEDLNVTVSQLREGQLRVLGSARSGDGTLALDGRTSFGSESGLRTELDVTGERFELLRLPDWQLVASPDLVIVMDEQTITVTGELAVPSADINLKSIPDSAQQASRDVVVHDRQQDDRPAPRRIDVDVRTIVGDEVRFAGFGLETGITGVVGIRGGTRDPLLGFGRIVLAGGRYKAYGQDLTIETGELIFNGPLGSPNLNVRATRQAGDVVAGIRLTGTPEELRSAVYSEPPLSDAEALSYLLTGRPLTGAVDAGEGDVLNQAAFALGLSRAAAVASQVQGKLGLDKLAVEGGGKSGRIVAGKRIGDRLVVEYGYGLIDKLGSLLLRYRLNERLFVESRTATTSSLDLIYSVRRK